MTNCKIIQILNEKTQNKYAFKLKNATLKQGGTICVLEIYYKDGVILSPAERLKFEKIIEENMPQGFVYDVKYIKNFVNSEAITPILKEFMKSNYPAIIYKIGEITKENKITLTVDEKSFERFESKQVQKQIKEYLTDYFCCDFEIVTRREEFAEVKEQANDDLDIDVQEKVDRTIPITDVVKYIGNQIDEKPMYIKDIKTPMEWAVVCGKIAFISGHELKPKTKKDDEKKQPPKTNEDLEKQAEEDAKAGEKLRKIYRLQIEDFSGKIGAVVFSTKNTLVLLEALTTGMEIVANGRVEEDKYNGGVQMIIKEISTCKLPENFVEKIAYKPEPKNYRYIFPEELEETSQVDLFDFSAGKTKQSPKHINENEFVVFDFETTGLQVTEGEKIIEIGAVKIKGGKIAERFMCFVNPEKHISDEITNLTGITDKDVESAYTIEKVLPDFYKFTRRAILVGQNVSFDYGFLNYYGKKCGYNFEAPMEDTWQLAMQNIKGMKNYKLKTICARLGVSLENAHRAVHDATATAECFIKLYELIEQNT